MLRLGRPGEKLLLDVIVGARPFYGRVVVARPAENYPPPRERFCYAAPFRFSRAFSSPLCGRVVVARQAENYPPPRERFCYVELFYSLEHSSPRGHHGSFLINWLTVMVVPSRHHRC